MSSPSNIVSKVKYNSNIHFHTVAKEFLSDKVVIQLNYSTIEKMGQKNYFFNLRRLVLSKENRMVYSKNGLCFNKTYADFILSARELFSFTYGPNGRTFNKNNALASLLCRSEVCYF